MKNFFQLVAVLTFASAAKDEAQIVSPDVLVSPPPHAPEVRRHEAETDNLQWLWQYAKPAPLGSKPTLLTDRRFPAVLDAKFKAPQAMWGTGVSLGEAARIFLGGDGDVASVDERHLRVTGCVVEHCGQRGLLWVDLGERDPLLVFAALRWNEQGHTTDEANASYTLWVFPSRVLDAHQLPGALKQSLSGWALGKACAPATITSAIVVDPNGIPHILGTLEAITPEVCSGKAGTTL